MVVINPIGANDVNAVLPEGRLVGGHPAIFAQGTDFITKQPQVDKSGQPKLSTYYALAIPKMGEQDWNQTAWGQLIYAEAMACFPNGEYLSPTFSWKIVDGDSMIPSDSGNKPAENEGWVGHWIIKASTSLAPVDCYKRLGGQFGSPLEKVTDKNAIKRGYYGITAISVKGNQDSGGKAGVFINPLGYCQTREGVEIVGEGAPTVNPTSAFGGSVMGGTPAHQAAYSAPAPQAPVATPTPAAPITLNAGFMAPPPPATPPAPAVRMVTYQGQAVKYDDLIAGGWSDAMILQHTTPVA